MASDLDNRATENLPLLWRNAGPDGAIGINAAALMAETHRPGQLGVAQLVDLRIANAAREIADRDLVRTRIGDVDFLDHQWRAVRYLQSGLALHERLLNMPEVKMAAVSA